MIKRRFRKVRHSINRERIWKPIWVPGATILDGHLHWVQLGYRNTDTNVYCCKCNKYTVVTNTYADLDGEPFRSYYCKSCKEEQGYY